LVFKMGFGGFRDEKKKLKKNIEKKMGTWRGRKE